MDSMTGEKLLRDVKLVLDDVEQLMGQAATAGTERAAELRDQAAAALETVRSRIDRATRDAARVAKDAADATDDWVHENPWSAIGIAAAVGLLIGVLATRR